MDSQTAQLITQLAASTGQVAQHLYTVLVAKIVIEGQLDLYFGIFLLALGLVLLGLTLLPAIPRVWAYIYKYDLEGPTIFAIVILSVLTIFCLVSGGMDIYNSYLERHAPEGVAIERLLAHIGTHQ